VSKRSRHQRIEQVLPREQSPTPGSLVLARCGVTHAPQEAEQLALDWSPWRTWVAVLVRAASPRARAGPRFVAREQAITVQSIER
jgi:hypothetical protein